MREGKVNPADAEAEQALGRMALWLDAADLEWLSQHCTCPADDDSQEQRDRCGRIRFRPLPPRIKPGADPRQAAYPPLARG